MEYRSLLQTIDKKSDILHFRPIALTDKLLVQRYAFFYGENSCQHDFANLYCTKNKYKTEVCERGGFLFLHQGSKDDAEFCSYLMPMGCGDMRSSVKLAMADAHGRGFSVKFDTVTEVSAQKLKALFPGQFDFEERRDMAEYLYTVERLVALKGPEMSRKRNILHNYERNYGVCTMIEPITPNDLPAVRSFQAKWLAERLTRENAENARSLLNENEAISLALDHYDKLELSGILLRIDGEIKGYAYGSRISADCYDVYAEKGSPEIRNIYPKLNRELTRHCCGSLHWVNREEDLGGEGMRKSKMSYRPDLLMRKFIARERL